MLDFSETYKGFTVRYSYESDETIDFEIERSGEVVSDGWTALRPGYDSVAHYVVASCL